MHLLKSLQHNFRKFLLVFLALAWVSCSFAQSGLEQKIAEGKDAGMTEANWEQKFNFLLPWFMAKPYEDKTLEVNEEEALVINTKAFDCVTFVENMLAAANAMGKEPGEGAFGEALQEFRYYEGEIEGYESRIHYFSAALAQAGNSNKGEDVFAEIGDDFDKEINFISSHPDKYPKLIHPNLLKLREDQLNDADLHYLPKNRISEYLKVGRDGDIIAFTTSIKGLDVVHTGFALRNEKGLRLVHASSKAGKVVEVSLKDYIFRYNYINGVIVFRPRL